MATKGGIKAGKAFIVIGAVDRTAAVMRRVQAKMKAFALRMQALGQSMLTKSLAALVPVGLSVKRFADFDDAMKKVEARSSGTAQSMAELRKQAQELGRSTSFTAVQVGDLQAKLAQKGFGRNAIKEMTDDVLALARAAGEGGEEDAVMSADLISGTLRAYQMEASEAGRVADVFTTAVNNSNFSLQGLLDGMAKAGPLASDFGLTLEETVATLASMTNLNITASESGVALQSFLARMSKGEFTGKFNKGLQALGKSAVQFRNAKGDLRLPLDLLKEIGEVTADLGTAERGDLLSILFGVRQFGKATGAARGAIDAFELLNKLQKDAAGQAKKTAKIMDSGLGGSFRKLISAGEGVMIALGEALEKPLARIADRLLIFLGGLSEWMGANKGLIILLVSLVAAVGGFGAGLIALAIGIKLVAVAAGALATVLTVVKVLMLALISPPGLVIAAIVAVGAALFTFSSSARSVMTQVASFFAEKFGQIGQTIKDTFSGIVDAIAMGDLQAAWEILGQGLTITWLQVVDTLAEAWEGFATFFIEAWEGAKMAVLQTWFSLQKTIAKGILSLAENAGVLGEVFDVIAGTDVSETKAKSAQLEQQRMKILRDRLKMLQAERQSLMGQKEAGRPVPLPAIQELDAQIADLKNSLKNYNDGFDEAMGSVGGTFDDKIDNAAVQTGKNLAKWNDRVGKSNKLRDDEIKREKENLNRMLEEIRTRKQQVEGAEALDEYAESVRIAEEMTSKQTEAQAGGAGAALAGLPGAKVSPTKALEEGTVAAAQKILELQFRDGTQQKQLKEAQKTNELLETQNELIVDYSEPVAGV